MSLDRPITSDERIEAIKQATHLYDETVAPLVEIGGPPPAGTEEEARGSADLLRNLFPELPDLTIAGFTSYVTVNCLTHWASSEDAGTDLLLLGLHMGLVTKQLAWSLGTPDAPEPKVPETSGPEAKGA